jgi:hypothetical protein
MPEFQKIPEDKKNSFFDDYIKWRDRNPDQPLFLPTGSIRAIITIGMVIFCGVIICQNKTVPDWFSSIVAMSIGFYFSGRSNPPKQ